MVRIKEEKKILTPDEKQLLKVLEKERERLFVLLAARPSEKTLVTALNELDIKICRVSGEKTIDY